MKYQFFTNTGIQFFGDPNISIAFDITDTDIPDGINGITNLQFSFQLLAGEWLPLALDNERNLIRFMYQHNKPVIYAIDTTIRKDGGGTHKNSLMETDKASTLSISPDLTNNEDNLHERIIANDFITEYVEDIFEKKSRSGKFKGYLDNNPNYKNYSPSLSYRALVASIIKNESKFLPVIDILADQGAAAAEIDTNFYIDLGNSRTIGLFVEKDINNHNYNIKNAAPFKLIDYKSLEKDGAKYLNNYATKKESDYDYLISSNLKFKKNIFSNYISRENFNLPNIICLGSEADDMKETIMQNPNTGISGPKRYLWSASQEKQFWNFHDGVDANNNISGEILKYIPLDDDDNVLNGIYPTLAAKPMQPMYPRRSMMIFAMVEIIFQAFNQVNSLHHRHRVGELLIKRKLKNIIMSFPTAMPLWERERLIKQSKKAFAILKKMNSIPYDINIKLGSDEATCSQVAFLYGEAKRFPGQGESFFHLISGKRRSSNLRIASLDIGGGTTDLMIADYERPSSQMAQSSDLVQKITYSDGVNFAGDDILKHLITTFVIECLRDAVIRTNNEDKFNEYFGQGAPQNDKQMRVEGMRSLFIPLAEFYMYYMSQSDSFSKAELQKIKTLQNLNEMVLKPRNLKPIKYSNYFENHEILKKNFINEIEIPNLIPDIKDLEDEVIKVYNDILFRFSWVISQHRPDFLILAGKTTSLPIIAKTLRANIALPPSKIISLKDYFIGEWHPFSNNGIVQDPKTSVVVGNAISDISIKKEMNDVNIVGEGANSNYTLNFMGANIAGNTFKKNMTIYDSRNPKDTPFQLQNKINILYRNIDDYRMSCNLMYEVELKRRENNINLSNNPIDVVLDTNNIKKEITIKTVSGEVVDSNTGQSRPVQKEDVSIKEKTLLDGEYYLDNGVFGVKVR